MLRIHREGYTILALLFVVLVIGVFLAFQYLPPVLSWVVSIALLAGYSFILQFFRNPKRPLPTDDPGLIYSPADGKVVVIETTTESEYFQDQRLQVSIFMSTWNVHANRIPLSGKVAYQKHHPGKYLVAWHPKSSEENERNTVVIEGAKQSLLFRQIAGAVARRIRSYIEESEEVRQGAEMGFIKFGSRVDLFLPLDTEILVEAGQQVKAGVTVLGRQVDR
jgi:phosphatidylserine decarboxylase